MNCDPLSRSKPFRLSTIEAAPDKPGVYGIWYKTRCIYVGKAVRQGVGTRLCQHWEASHNYLLQLWIEAARGELTFNYCLEATDHRIDVMERYYVRKLQPDANIFLKL
jgi:excinuclease UvrABC nuclease subunit